MIIEQRFQTITQKIFMRRKLKMEVERERKRERERENVLIRFSVNATFPTLCQKLLFSLSCFSVLFLLF